MKNSLLLFGLLLLLSSCNKNKGIMRQDAKIAITGVNNFTRAEPSEALGGIMGSGITDSVAFCAKYIEAFHATSLDGTSNWQSASFGMTEENYANRHDLVNNKLLYEGGHVIHSLGGLGDFVVNCQDACFYVFADRSGNVIYPAGDLHLRPDWSHGMTRDTVAYIPNAVINKARIEIMAAFEREDYAACYRLFDEAFVFVPTTGAKWRAMKAAGIE